MVSFLSICWIQSGLENVINAHKVLLQDDWSSGSSSARTFMDLNCSLKNLHLFRNRLWYFSICIRMFCSHQSTSYHLRRCFVVWIRWCSIKILILKHKIWFDATACYVESLCVRFELMAMKHAFPCFGAISLNPTQGVCCMRSWSSIFFVLSNGIALNCSTKIISLEIKPCSSWCIYQDLESGDAQQQQLLHWRDSWSFFLTKRLAMVNQKYSLSCSVHSNSWKFLKCLETNKRESLLHFGAKAFCSRCVLLCHIILCNQQDLDSNLCGFSAADLDWIQQISLTAHTYRLQI